MANPDTNIDAYVWVKPPGESDGVSEPGIMDPVDPHKRYDSMCGPDEENRIDPSVGTGAMAAPHAGRWNEAHFEELLQNAYPSLN